ncbi:MAG: glycosyltransferase family 39 protein [Tepidisphaeraceae bacterium]
MARTNLRLACLCGVVVLIAFLIVNPFAEMPFDDDWSYAFTVRRLLETGHIIYNGWSAPVLITQVYWGAMFCKVFGFSFTALRFSMLPFAMGSAVICFLLGRLSGLRSASAVFAALLLGLSPMFLPLATSFMTDVPGLFFMLFSIYALAKSALTRRIAWLAAAVVAAIIGGMSRQVVWIVPLISIPYLLWIGRNDRRFRAAAVAGWILVLIDVIATQSWFSSQHDVVIDPPLLTCLQSAMRNPWFGLDRGGRFILTLFLLTLPVGAGLAILVANACRHRMRLLVLSVLVGAALALDIHFHRELLLWPWSPNLLWPDGILIRNELSGRVSAAMPEWFVTAWSVLVFIALGASLATLLDSATRWRNLVTVAKRIFFPRNGDAVLIIMAIVGIAYLALLLARSTLALVFDRYALPMVPIVAIFTLLFVQRSFPDSRIRRFTFTICSIVLAFYAALSLAATRDLLALARARVQAINMLRDAGVAPTAIAAGLEYDCWTQLHRQRQVNWVYASNRTVLFRPQLGLAPALWCLYRVEYLPAADTQRSEFPPIRYTSWLPPFHRTIYIDKFLDPWWISRPPTDGRSPKPGLVDFETF